ncbi:MAG: LPS assembly protein LptD [Candidatus Omnitrophota bacterium]
MKKIKTKKNFFIFFWLFNFLSIFLLLPAFAQEEKMPIVVNGDKVEFMNEEKKIIASGHVVIEYKDTKLVADKVVVYSQTKDIIAEGNVRLDYEKGTLKGERVVYNFQDKTGSIIGANIKAEPFFGKSPISKKISERELIMRRGYITTCDLPKPHWRIAAKQTQIFPEDRIVAKDASFFIGNWPILTLPQFVQVLNDRRPRVTVVPGKDKDWGYYLLTAWRYYFNEGAKGRLHLDYREKKDFAHGIDLSYKPKDMGEGLLRTYYMHERAIQSKNIWAEDRNTLERERFRIQWKHKWQINDKTGLLWQYNKVKDSEFLKDYFFREHEIDKTPNTYAQLTQAHDLFSLNMLLEKRVNRFMSTVEKLPQAKLETTNFRIGSSKFYFKSDNDLSNLINQTAGQTTYDDITNRFDTFNKITYPTKVAFVYVSPYVGMRNTYYSKSQNENSIWREAFYSGADLSTRFFRVFDVKGKFLGIDINRLRHVINPTITYAYIHKPSVSSSDLFNFDKIDSISKENSLNLALENKFQTKQKLEASGKASQENVDLITHILSTDYYLRDSGTGGHFADILNSVLELRPKKGFRIDIDTDYNRRRDAVITNNTDFYFDREDKFSLGVGHRYQKDQNNQFNFDVFYRINPKWKARVYERFDFTGGGLKEQQYILTRDLHCWLMEFTYRVDRDRGESVWLKFTIKAFPEVGFEFNNSYHEPKAGSQSY